MLEQPTTNNEDSSWTPEEESELLKDWLEMHPPIEAKESSLSDLEKDKNFEDLSKVFDEGERVFAAEGREKTKPFLNQIYETMKKLNHTELDIYPFAKWNPKGDLKEDHFNELNLRRKKLSNAVGIMTASGVVRHDLNKLD